MPATQTVEFFAAPGQTVTAKLFSQGSDTEVASVSATEQTNRKGVYRAVYTDVAAGLYRLLALVGTTPIATWWTDLTLTTATFQTYEVPISTVVGGVYNASPSAGWVNGSFGDRSLVANTPQRTVFVTGANHLAADVHAMQTDVVNANALASDAATEIANAVASTQALSRLGSMIESDGAGQFRFDTIALSMGAGGGGAVNIVVEDRSITVE